MMLSKIIFLPLIIAAFLSISSLSQASMQEDRQALLKKWTGKIHKASETIIEQEGSPKTCVNIVRAMTQNLYAEWDQTLSTRDALLKKLGRPIPKSLLFDFDQWSEDFLEDSPSGIKKGVTEIIKLLEDLVSQINNLEIDLETLTLSRLEEANPLENLTDSLTPHLP